MSDHFHVVSYVNGCLNDYDSGPLSLEDARMELAAYAEDCYDYPGSWVARGVDRYVQVDGYSVAEILPCAENCYHEEG